MGVSQLRRYKHSGNKRLYIEAWIIKQCKQCGRFLSKREIKYCKKCSNDKIRYLREKEYRIKNAKKYYERNEENINYKRWLNRERHRTIL